jgi:long-chain acyl-CoA synthetase
MGINIARVLRHWALAEPERVALISWEQGQRREISYGELDQRARRAARVLAAQGVAPGTRLALSLQNGLAFLDAWFGGAYLGATLLPVPPMSAPPELSFRLRHAGCVALITDQATSVLGQAALRDAPGVLSIAAEALAEAEPQVDARGSAGEQNEPGPVDLPADACAMVLYTSGTTDTPKGALITHASLLAHTAALVHHTLRLSGDDVVLGALPLTHSYGIRMTLLCPFYAGARVVLMRRFTSAPALALLAQEQVSWFPGVPTMFHALGQAPQAQGLSTRAGPRPSKTKLRWCLSAGAPLPREIRSRAELALGVPVRQGYGLTEATFASIADPDDPGAEESVGRAVFGVELRVVDAQGAPLPSGATGEVCVRGQNVMAGYLDDPEATRAALRDGWLHSGDLGVLDASGRLRIVDRSKDLIIRGGFNVVPAEVEAVLVSHPAVLDAVVVGVPDAHYGEEVAAVVVWRAAAPSDLSELVAFCAARLSRTKLPRLLGAVAQLPVGPSGKVQRRVIRSELDAGRIALTALPKASA